METLKPNYIEKKSSDSSGDDFELLVAKGIELLQKLSGDKWTDFNSHDPGVTILEQLCFALTELSYKLNFKLEDILSNEFGIIDKADNCFIDKENILTTCPSTINDYRKLILDEITEIDNIHLVPIVSKFSTRTIKGIYKIIVQANDVYSLRFYTEPELESLLIEKVRKCLLSNRNITEDFFSQIIVLKPKFIKISASVIVKEDYLAEEIHLNIYKKIKNYFSPKIKFHSESELLEQGIGIENMYSGPLLKNGILHDSELKPRIQYVDPINLLSEIQKADGVLQIQYLFVNDSNLNEEGRIIEIEDGWFPYINIDNFTDNVKLSSYTNKLRTDKSLFASLVKEASNVDQFDRSASTNVSKRFAVLHGIYRQLGQYYSIQNNFPVVYGLGEDGLSAKESDARKGQVKQLKAYLIFFEQILANFAQQLNHLGDYFSTDINEEQPQTYYSQPLYQIPRVKDILKPDSTAEEWDLFTLDLDNSYCRVLNKSQESFEVFAKRKNKMFDHLYARFNEKFNSYAIKLYHEFYAQEENYELMELKWKSFILKNYAELSYYKSNAPDYSRRDFETTGFEKRIKYLLNIKNNSSHFLSEIFEKYSVGIISDNSSETKSKNEITQPKVNEFDIDRRNLFIGMEEMQKLDLSEDLEELNGDNHNLFTFKKQGVEVLKYGVKINNYRIGPVPTGGPGAVIVFKNPNTNAWSVVSSHSDKNSAKEALDRLISFLRNLSIQSEGFHLIEHLLLRNPLTSNSFGFKFYAKHNYALMENADWTDFEQREKTIEAIVQKVSFEKNPAGLQIEKNYNFIVRSNGGNEEIKLFNSSHFNVDKPNESLNSSLLRDLNYSMMEYKNNKTNYYPNFELVTRLSTNQIISEDFYNLRATVVLPNWPARFQDPEFKKFVEELFRNSSPGFLRLKFLWLELGEMKEFEKNYFEWLKLLREDSTETERNKVFEKLIFFLGGNDYIL